MKINDYDISKVSVDKNIEKPKKAKRAKGEKVEEPAFAGKGLNIIIICMLIN